MDSEAQSRFATKFDFFLILCYILLHKHLEMTERTDSLSNNNSQWVSPVPDSTEGPLPSPEQLLEGPVFALWHRPNTEPVELQDDLGWVELALPGVGLSDAHFSGFMVIKHDLFDDTPTMVMETGTVIIPRELEGHHLGEKLVRAMGYEAIEQGCEEMEVDFKHPASFRAFVKVFGFDRMEFNGGLSGKTEEEIMERLDMPRGHRPKLINMWSTEALVNLNGIDISEWEPPERYFVPEEADAW